MDSLREKRGYPVRHGRRDLSRQPAAARGCGFVEWLCRENKRFLFLTNSSERSPGAQTENGRLGLDIVEEHFYTSALATADLSPVRNRCQCLM
jgi:NagD protein